MNYWGSIAAIAAAFIVTGSTIIGIFYWCRRRLRLRRPFSIAYVENINEFPPPNASLQRYLNAKEIHGEENSLYVRMRINVGLTIRDMDFRLVERHCHSKWGIIRKSEWRNASRGDIWIDELKDSDADRTPIVIGGKGYEPVDNRVGGKEIRYRPSISVLKGESLWFSIKIKTRQNWSGYLQIQGPNENNQRAFSRISLAVTYANDT